jgi:hypothetical protein
VFSVQRQSKSKAPDLATEGFDGDGEGRAGQGRQGRGSGEGGAERKGVISVTGVAGKMA